MNKQLVILFTDANRDWNTINRIPDRSGSDRDPYQIPESRPDPGRVLLVFNDEPMGGLDDDESFREEANVDWADEVYVAWHNSDEYHDPISHIRLAPEQYQHEEEGDRAYKAFREVIENEAKDGPTEEMEKWLEELVDALDVNWLLEAKLEILHRCLTPEGAKTVIPEHPEIQVAQAERFPEGYYPERKSLLKEIKLNESPIDGNEAKWSVEEIVCALANRPKSNRELPDEKRQHALTMMRDAFLKDE